MKTSASLLLCLFFFGLSGQIYEPDPCEGSGNTELKKVLVGGTLDYLYLDGCGPGWTDAVTSSFLKASKPPAKPIQQPSIDEIDDAWEDYYISYDQWSCTYAPSNLSDGNTATAWVEGAPGYGIGEVVLVAEIDVFRSVQIWNGYGKSASLYSYNGRVKKARIHILSGRMAGATQCGTVFKDVKKVASKEISLLDRNEYQPLDLPEFTKATYNYQDQEWQYSYWLAIEILDVFPGSKWEDTCISEVRNF